MDKLVSFAKKYLLWIIGAVFLVLYLYSDMIFDNYKISFASHMYMVSPWSSTGTEYKGPRFTDIEDSEYPALYSIFKDGDGFEQWNNKVALGTTSSYSYILYPLNYIYLLPVDIAVFIKVCMEFFAALLGIYLLMREYENGKAASVIAAITYTFSATMVVWLGWGHSDVAAFAPFAFLFAEKLINKVKLKYAIHLAIVIFIMYIAGMPTFAAYFTYLLGFYVLIKTLKKYWTDKAKIIWTYGYFGLSMLLGVGLTLPYTILLVQSVGGNGYADSRANSATARLEYDYLRTFIYPFFRNNLHGHINETTLYCGILAIIILPMTFFNMKKKKQVYFYGISTLILLTLIFTPTLDIIFTKMPMINSSLKSRVITLLMFTMSILLGINLNDIFENREYYKSKIYSIGILFVWGVAVISIASSSIVTLTDGDAVNTAYNEYTDYSEYYSKAVWLMLIFVILISAYILKGRKIAIFAIAMAVIFDVCGFAKEYFPLIEKDATVIPKKTDTIEYLQNNIENNERIAGIGEWTLMANSNEYYGLNDVRMHDFVATNKDIVDYYLAIDDRAFVTPTRITFKDIDNYNLLKYIGVKYLVGTEVTADINYSSNNNSFGTTEEIPAATTVSQEFIADRDILYSIKILVGTCDTEYLSAGSLKAKIIDSRNGKVLGETDIENKDVVNNSFVEVIFKEVELEAGEKYIFEVETPDDFEEILVLYKTGFEEDENELYVENEHIDGHLIMVKSYWGKDVEKVYKGEDGLTVAIFDEYSDKAYLSENVFEGSDEDILEGMQEEYIENAVFINNEDAASDIASCELKDNEGVNVVEYDDDYIKLTYTSNEKRYLVLNDYYDPNWKAYVNGKKVEIKKVNYLVRAIEAPAGENVKVEFKYEPKTTELMIYASVADLIVIIALSISNFVYCKKKRDKSEKSLDK